MTVQRLLEAVSGLGYRPSQDGAVRASVDGKAMKVEAGAGAATYAAGATGVVKVVLEPKQGVTLGDGQATTVTVTGDDVVSATRAETSVAEAITARREVEVPIQVKAGATPGARAVTVRITTKTKDGLQTVDLRVEVVVQ